MKKYRFYATIEDMPYEKRIKFGGARQCINISVYNDDNRPNINGISYDSECSIDRDLVPGDGTVDMVRCALKFVVTLFPDTKMFMFKDHSKITCKNKMEIPLYYYYIAKHGRTWYSLKFGAKPKIKEDSIKGLLTYLKDSPMLSIEEFDKMYVKESGCQLRNFSNYFRNDYNSSKNYLEFLQKVISSHDCGILMSWFQYFMYNNCAFNFGEAFWVIKRKDIDTWEDIKYSEIESKPRFKSMHSGGFFPFGKN